MLEVKEVQIRYDRNGKEYKYIRFRQPVQYVNKTLAGRTFQYLDKEREAGYVAYPVNYSSLGLADPFAELNEGDIIEEARLVTKKVAPHISSDGNFITSCTVPVFANDEDPVAFDIAMEEAFFRAGKYLEEKELLQSKSHYIVEKETKRKEKREIIPENCLIVKTFKK